MDVGEAEVSSLIAIGQSGVVNAQKVKDGGVEIVDVHGSRRPVFFVGLGVHWSAVFVGDVVAVVVGSSVSDAGLNAAAGHPNGKASGMVVAAVVVLFESSLAIGCSSEFAAPNDEGFVEHAAAF